MGEADSSPPAIRKKVEPKWDYTEYGISVAKKKGYYEESGPAFGKEKYAQGRPIIGRDTEINGGFTFVRQS